MIRNVFLIAMVTFFSLHPVIAQTDFQFFFSRGINHAWSPYIGRNFDDYFEKVPYNYTMGFETTVYKDLAIGLCYSFLEYHEGGGAQRSPSAVSTKKRHMLNLNVNYYLLKTQKFEWSTGYYLGYGATKFNFGQERSFTEEPDYSLSLSRVKYFPFTHFGLQLDLAYGTAINANILLGLTYKL